MQEKYLTMLPQKSCHRNIELTAELATLLSHKVRDAVAEIEYCISPHRTMRNHARNVDTI
jgi:hypothetical protein